MANKTINRRPGRRRDAHRSPDASSLEDIVNGTLPIDDIIVGPRIRNDLGDIASLAASISALGLLQPIVVTSKHHLVAGERRLAACKMLGWVNIPVRILERFNDH